MQLTKNIRLEEVVPRITFQRHGQRAIRFMSGEIIRGMQFIVDRHGLNAIHINNWLWGGDKEQRGLRIQGQHHWRGDGLHDTGQALDCVPIIRNKTVQDVLRDIHLDAIANPILYQNAGVHRIETLWLASTWLHIDCMFTPGQQGVVFIDMTKRYTPIEYREELRKRKL